MPSNSIPVSQYYKHKFREILISSYYTEWISKCQTNNTLLPLLCVDILANSKLWAFKNKIVAIVINIDCRS